jgi:hypothetical protein
LEKLLKVGIIILVEYSKWVTSLSPVHKMTNQFRLCVDFIALNQAIIKGHFPLPNIEMILQQVAGSHMMPLPDVFSGYNQIKVKEADKFKTTFITHWGNLTCERIPSDLSDACTTFKIPMQITLDDLIGKVIHVYLDDLIVFKITFFLGTNSYILKDLQERLFPTTLMVLT